MFNNLSLDMFRHLMPNNPPPPNLRDFQRQKLYRFEEARLQKHPFNQDLALTECTALARKYNPRIKVKDGRGRRHAGASFGEKPNHPAPVVAPDGDRAARDRAHIG